MYQSHPQWNLVMWELILEEKVKHAVYNIDIDEISILELECLYNTV